MKITLLQEKHPKTNNYKYRKCVDESRKKRKRTSKYIQFHHCCDLKLYVVERNEVRLSSPQKQARSQDLPLRVQNGGWRNPWTPPRSNVRGVFRFI